MNKVYLDYQSSTPVLPEVLEAMLPWFRDYFGNASALHELGIRINTGVSGSKIGMSYDVTFKGEHLATVANSSPKGKSLLTTDLYYDVICEEKDLDLVFLTAFSIAKTEQTFYN